MRPYKEDPLDFNPLYGRRPKVFGMESEIFFLFIFSWVIGAIVFAILAYVGVPFALFPTISLGGFMSVVIATGGNLATAMIRSLPLPIYIRSAARYKPCFPRKISINPRRRSRR
jgi:hypothetical protein